MAGRLVSPVIRAVRTRRSLWNIPGSDARKLAKASTIRADSVVLDLEDGVPFSLKDSARCNVTNMLKDDMNTIINGVERCVRINDTRSGLAEDDLAMILCPQLQCIVIPKVESPDDLSFVDGYITSCGELADCDIRLIACIESARGLVNLRDIASYGGRLDALVFASEDLCADMGIIRTRSAEELLWARSRLVTYAKAYDLQAIDFVCMNFRDDNLLREQCEQGRRMGFTGKQVIHLGQIDIVSETFLPSSSDSSFAQRVIDGYTEHVTKNSKGAFELDGKMIDLPVVKWAMRVQASIEASKH